MDGQDVESEFHRYRRMGNPLREKDLQSSRFWVIAGNGCAVWIMVLVQKYYAFEFGKLLSHDIFGLERANYALNPR